MSRLMANNHHHTDRCSQSMGVPSSQQPIGDAVSTAVDNCDVHNLDPKLIEQITKNVIIQLRGVNTQATSSSSQHTSPAPPSFSQNAPQTVSSTENSPDLFARDVHISQSPEKHTEALSTHSPKMRPGRQTHADDDYPTRPRGPPRLSTAKEQTPLEKIWGSLFDEEGVPTPRLSQFFRGIAVHLIEKVEPRDSIVVTPQKLISYYSRLKLDKEHYPWHIIFDDGVTYVSRIFRELGCQHHLVQEDDFERPDIPGLTPRGFSKWMTMMLMAHPEEEYERLKKAVVTMAINNPDDTSERFPKDISRRLLPNKPDAKVRRDLRKAIRKHSKKAELKRLDDDIASDGESDEFPDISRTDTFGTIPSRQSTAQREPPSDAGDSSSATAAPPIERNRQPYSSSSFSTADSNRPPMSDRFAPTSHAGESALMDDEDLTPRPIERERRQYAVQPGGGGRMYEEPAGSRNIYPLQPPVNGGNRVSSATAPIPIPGSNSSSTILPPLGQQNSVGPAPPLSAPNLARSGSMTGCAGPPPPPNGNSSNAYGPPPAPSAGSSLPPEIHQYPPQAQAPPQQAPPSTMRRGSFTRRRAPSASQAYPTADPRRMSDEARASAPPQGPPNAVSFAPNSSYESRSSELGPGTGSSGPNTARQGQAVYPGGGGGQEGYDELSLKRSRGQTFGLVPGAQQPGHAAAPPPPPPPPQAASGIVGGGVGGLGRRDSLDRRSGGSPPKRRDSRRHTSPVRNSWSGFSGAEEFYRDRGRY